MLPGQSYFQEIVEKYLGICYKIQGGENASISQSGITRILIEYTKFHLKSFISMNPLFLQGVWTWWFRLTTLRLFVNGKTK